MPHLSGLLPNRRGPVLRPLQTQSDAQGHIQFPSRRRILCEIFKNALSGQKEKGKQTT